MSITVESLRPGFEKWFAEKYDWQIRRGSRGKLGAHLSRFEGEYISDIARNDFVVWCAAHGLKEGL